MPIIITDFDSPEDSPSVLYEKWKEADKIASQRIGFEDMPPYLPQDPRDTLSEPGTDSDYEAERARQESYERQSAAARATAKATSVPSKTPEPPLPCVDIFGKLHPGRYEF